MNIAESSLFTAWFIAHPYLTIVLLFWSLFWKGYALWKAAGLRQKYWFIVILILNTFGILDIIYIFTVARKYEVEVIEK